MTQTLARLEDALPVLGVVFFVLIGLGYLAKYVCLRLRHEAAFVSELRTAASTAGRAALRLRRQHLPGASAWS